MEASEPEKIDRQAVVIIHGMGEQRPMDTLRSFVQGITYWIKNGERSRDTKPYYWSRPDGISEMYETRRVTMQKHGGNPKTDFYEFYWAHHMRNTSFEHLVPWMKKLLFTARKKVPPRLKKIQTVVRIILLLIIVLAGILYWKRAFVIGYIKEHWIRTAGLLAFATLVFRMINWAVKKPISQILLNTAGDAARYFNPMPSNIEERSSIRREGIAFLKKLHDRTDKPYNRIIVVGHSLGSVVAYDLIRLLWHEMHEKFDPKAMASESCFKEMSAYAIKAADKTYTMSKEELQHFQKLQHRCWQQYKANGNKWLISDFITCAGAIAHADFFLINKPDFEDFIKFKEFPASPPVIEGDDTSVLHYPDKKKYEIGKDAGGNPAVTEIAPLNHAAPFAVTRWTNIYFTSDFVGSAARRIFRQGIKDIEIKRKGWMLLPGGHTNYWDDEPGNKALECIACAIGFKQVAKPASSGKKNS